MHSWLTSNFLSLNLSKTEFVVFSRNQTGLLLNLNIRGTNISSTTSLKCLGVILDSKLSLSSHIDYVCRICYLHLRNIYYIKEYLNKASITSLIHAFVTCRLDYCNSLLIGLPKRLTHKLQKVQNSAARLLEEIPRREHITSALKHLHWLPIVERIKFKILCTTHKSIRCLAPQYLQSRVALRESNRITRSTNTNELIRPRAKYKIGERGFNIAGPTLWNQLPSPLRIDQSFSTFKRNLKTHLFNMYFN